MYIPKLGVKPHKILLTNKTGTLTNKKKIDQQTLSQPCLNIWSKSKERHLGENIDHWTWTKWQCKRSLTVFVKGSS